MIRRMTKWKALQISANSAFARCAALRHIDFASVGDGAGSATVQLVAVLGGLDSEAARIGAARAIGERLARDADMLDRGAAYARAQVSEA